MLPVLSHIHNMLEVCLACRGDSAPLRRPPPRTSPELLGGVWAAGPQGRCFRGDLVLLIVSRRQFHQQRGFVPVH